MILGTSHYKVCYIWLILCASLTSRVAAYPVCYICGCEECKIGNLNGLIPIPPDLRPLVGGLEEVSCRLAQSAGNAGVIPPEFCALNQNATLLEICGCQDPRNEVTEVVTLQPSTASPTGVPTAKPFSAPTSTPTTSPTFVPTGKASTTSPTEGPTAMPTASPMMQSATPEQTSAPTLVPLTNAPSKARTKAPTGVPFAARTAAPTKSPTKISDNQTASSVCHVCGSPEATLWDAMAVPDLPDGIIPAGFKAIDFTCEQLSTVGMLGGFSKEQCAIVHSLDSVKKACVCRPSARMTLAPSSTTKPLPPTNAPISGECNAQNFRGQCSSSTTCRQMYDDATFCSSGAGGVCFCGIEMCSCLPKYQTPAPTTAPSEEADMTDLPASSSPTETPVEETSSPSAPEASAPTMAPDVNTGAPVASPGACFLCNDPDAYVINLYAVLTLPPGVTPPDMPPGASLACGYAEYAAMNGFFTIEDCALINADTSILDQCKCSNAPTGPDPTDLPVEDAQPTDSPVSPVPTKAPVNEADTTRPSTEYPTLPPTKLFTDPPIVDTSKKECFIAYLWDADADSMLSEIQYENGAIDKFCTPDFEYNIEATFECSQLYGDIASLSFHVVGPHGMVVDRTERVAPYFAFGQDYDFVIGKRMDAGTYTITLTADFESRETSSYSETFQFEVADCKCELPIRPVDEL